MIINCDVERLNELGLTANQFVIGYLIHLNKRDLLVKFRKNFPESISPELKVLIAKGYLLDEGAEKYFEYEKLFASPTFNDLIYIDGNDAWDELRTAYPMRDDGRPLQGDLAKTKTKYLRIIDKDKTLHRNILSCIQREKDDRQRAKLTGRFRPSWKMLSTYINQEAWKLYEEQLIKDKDNNPIVKDSGKLYGGDIQ